jgi:uncharacterized protein (TIGR03437 family)
LRLYDATTGNFAVTRPASVSGITSIVGNVAASTDGSYYHAASQILSDVLVASPVIPSGLPGTQVAVTGFAFSQTGSMGYRGVRSTTALGAATPVPRIEIIDAAALKLVSSFNIAEALIVNSSSLLTSVQKQLMVNAAETTLYGISETGLEAIPLPAADASPAPQINAGGVVNGASYALAPAPVAPGSIANIFGINLAGSIAQAGAIPLPTTLSGLCVIFDGVAAPIFSVSPLQVNVQVPWELAGKTTAQVSIASDAAASAPVTVNLARIAPGIFTHSDNGQGPGRIVHSSDFSFVSTSNPATIGEVISIYATGFGPTAPVIATGAGAPTDGTLYVSTTPTVSIGGASAQVLFAGLAPGFVGLYQVDVRIPSAAQLGLSVPVTVSFGSSASNSATIAIVQASR